MSYAGPIHRFRIDYNSWNPSDRSVGTLLTHSDSPVQTQLTPPRVGDVVIAHDPDVGLDSWAIVLKRHGQWLGLRTEEPIPTFSFLGEQ